MSRQTVLLLALGLMVTGCQQASKPDQGSSSADTPTRSSTPASAGMYVVAVPGMH